MSRSFLEIRNSDLRVKFLVYCYFPYFFHLYFSKYFENVSIGVSLFDRTYSQINRSYIWFLRGIFSETWSMCLGLLQLTPFILSGLRKFNSVQGRDLRPCLLKKLVEFTEELVQSIAKVGLCSLLTPSRTYFVKSEYFSMDCCGTGNGKKRVSFLCLCLGGKEESSTLTKA